MNCYCKLNCDWTFLWHFLMNTSCSIWQYNITPNPSHYSECHQKAVHKMAPISIYEQAMIILHYIRDASVNVPSPAFVNPFHLLLWHFRMQNHASWLRVNVSRGPYAPRLLFTIQNTQVEPSICAVNNSLISGSNLSVRILSSLPSIVPSFHPTKRKEMKRTQLKKHREAERDRRRERKWGTCFSKLCSRIQGKLLQKKSINIDPGFCDETVLIVWH